MATETKRIILQIALFIATFITTTLAGAEWVYSRSILIADDYSWKDFQSGLAFSVPLLLILTCHEFGHYFTALYHRIKTSLPYYIPLPFLAFGTMGAVIRLRERPHTTRQTFDIGIAGPLAGFVVALALLIYGIAALPPAEYIYQFHPEYEQYGADYASHVYDYSNLKAGQEVLDMKVGKSLLFMIAESFVSDPSRIPNTRELMHYPVLFAVFFALFVTSLNLLPLGQLDGGHVVFGLFGYRKHKIIASAFFVALLSYAGIGNPYISLQLPKMDLLLNMVIYVAFMYFALLVLRLKKRDTLMYALLIVLGQFMISIPFPKLEWRYEWFILGIIFSRLVGIEHPPSEVEQPLDSKRIMLGWLCLLIFILCFTPVPMEMTVITGK